MPLTNTAYLGTNAKITYTATTGGSVTFQLSVPLRELMPSYNVTRYVRDSLDFRSRTVFAISSTVSTGVVEWTGVVRFNKDRPGLIKLIKNGMLGQTLTYKKTTASTGEACYLIEPSKMPADVTLDRGRGLFNDVEVTLRLRKTNLATFSTKAL